jgi:putative DNA methylase
VALTTVTELVEQARARVSDVAEAGGLTAGTKGLAEGGTGAQAYADAVAVYLGLAVDRIAMTGNNLVRWNPVGEKAQHCFGRQGLPMLWDFAEPNFLATATGSMDAAVFYSCDPLTSMVSVLCGTSKQDDAAGQSLSQGKLVSTDPPYYDNIGYADLSDFFYAWLRRSLKPVFAELFSTLAVPKAAELVATPYRHGSKEKAESFFLDGMTNAMHRLAAQAHPGFPVTIYYAFKQSETDSGESTSSTGWETFLEAVICAGFSLTGTWPIRTEMKTRQVAMDSNALASSIVLVCRPRPTTAPTATRREFVNALKSELPAALAHLQAGNIAPVDLAQAAIGPGMGVYTRYSKVLDAEGKPLTVRDALTLINQTLDEALAEQEGDFDADSRWALTWFEQSGFSEGDYGVAEQLSKSKNTSVAGMVEAGILHSSRGKVHLYKPSELPSDWDPTTDTRLTAWEMVHQLIRVLEAGGEAAAAALASKLGTKAETARELCYRLYTICERKKRSTEALSYNALVQSWPEILRLSKDKDAREPEQQSIAI